jgi:DNA-binding XRE family transcriptional regulator
MDLTQEELARRVGCAAITLRKIEADDLRPSVQIDLLITGSVGLSIAISLAEKYHLPLLQAHLIPITPTKTFPSILVPQNSA